MPQAFHLRKAFDGCEPSSGIYEKLEYSVSHAKAIDTHRPKLGHIQIHGWTYLRICRISRSLGETIQILSEIKTRDFGFVFGELDLFSEKVVICFRIICNLFLENRTFPPALPHALKYRRQRFHSTLHSTPTPTVIPVPPPLCAHPQHHVHY